MTRREWVPGFLVQESKSLEKERLMSVGREEDETCIL